MAAPGVHLYEWDVRLATREEQETHWDPVARCYLIDLRLDDFGAASRPCRVRVDFQTASGGTLEAAAQMQTFP